MTIPLVFAWTVVLVLSLVFAAVSGLALYAAIFTHLKDDTELLGRALMYYGRGLIVLTIAATIIGATSGLISILLLGIRVVAYSAGR